MSRIKISTEEKDYIRNLQESDNLSGWGTQIWGTQLQEQITTTCTPCPAGTRYPAVMTDPICGKRVKCTGPKCSDVRKKNPLATQSCCDDEIVGTYKIWDSGAYASCNCYQEVPMKYCK